MARKLLEDNELTVAVDRLDGWSVSGKAITTKRAFPDFSAALSFVNEVGELAEAADHHPDITFGWGYAEISLTTHDRGGVTDVDIALAEKIDVLSRS